MNASPLHREVVIDRMMDLINGPHNMSPARPGHLSRERAALSLELFGKSKGNPLKSIKTGEPLAKTVTTETGLTYYDLRAPALNLFPTVTPLRNAIPRQQRPQPGEALHYKAVLATIGSGWPYMGWVPEGQRTASMNYVTQNVTVPYVTLGEEDSLTEEARYAAVGFEDEDALVQLRLLLKIMVKEEAGILGGNAGLQLGTPGLITAAGSGSGHTLPTNTYSVKVVALTQEGYLNSNLVNGLATQLVIKGNDGQSYTLNGGASNISAGVTAATTAGQALTASVPIVNGAVAYGWFVSATVGSEALQAITTINSISIGTTLTTGTQLAGAISGDNSANPQLAFNGLLTTAYINGAYSTPNAYVVALDKGTTAGLGTGLTPTGTGGIAEINTMLLSMWTKYNISPTVLYVNAQELNNITVKVLSNTSGPLLRYNTSADDAGMPEYKITAAGVVAFYFNPYTADGGIRIPIKIHPNLAPGTLIGWAEILPPWYVSNATPSVAVMQTRADYYNEVWPKTTRAQFYGIYCQETLAVFAPFSMGIITNIGNL